MSAIRFHVVLAGVALVALLSPAAQAGPFMEWLCGCSSNMSSATTYAPAYVPTPVAAAPVANCACEQQSTYYAPAPVTAYYAPAPVTAYYAPAPVTTYYAPAPITTYRPFLPIVPRPTSTYYASTSYNPYSAAPVTVYRPILGIATPPVIPYTSYRMVYPAQVTYYSPAVSYYSAPAACPVYDMPVQSAAPDSCCAPSSSTMETPTLPSDQSSTSYYIPSQPDSSTIITAKPNTDDSATVTRQVEKPITSSDPKAAPTDEKASGLNLNEQKQQNQPKAKENSLPLPNSRDSQDRTTMRPVRQVSHEKAVPAQPSGQVLSADLWHQAND
jgi:hypothetical protein